LQRLSSNDKISAETRLSGGFLFSVVAEWPQKVENPKNILILISLTNERTHFKLMDDFKNKKYL